MEKRATAHTFYESLNSLTPVNEAKYRRWIHVNATNWLRRGRMPPSALLDRIGFRFFRGRAKVVYWLMRLVGRLPIVWHVQPAMIKLRERWIIENCPPTRYRQFIVHWSIETIINTHYRVRPEQPHPHA